MAKSTSITVPKPRLLASGSWFIQLRLGGESIPVTSATEKECIAAAMQIKAAHQAGKAAIKSPRLNDDLILKDAIDKYILSRKSILKDRSIEQYEYIRDHRFQSIMLLKLGNITNAKLDEALEKELQKPSRKGGTVSPKTVKDAYMFISTVLNKYMPTINTDVELPEIQRSFPELLSPKDIFAAVKGTDVELPAMLSMWLSLSMSEIRGLTKSKSIRKGKIYIVETVVDVKGKPARKPGGKEENRPRCLDIPPYIKALIDKVETDEIEPRSGHAVYMRFQNVLKSAGLPHMKFHSLRHVNASVMADLNIPTPIAQERGGWKTDSTMKRVYTHTFTSSRRQADNKMDTFFGQIVKESANKNANNIKKMRIINAYTVE